MTSSWGSSNVPAGLPDVHISEVCGAETIEALKPMLWNVPVAAGVKGTPSRV